LLQRGAAKVHAVDVGYGQLAWSLRQDPRVQVWERTNARHLDTLGEPIELLVGDLSFISLRKILPAVARLAAPGADCVLLVKPQFEVGREGLAKGGLVRDVGLRDAAVAAVLDDAVAAGFDAKGQIESPITGAKSGNVEFLVWLVAPLEQPADPR
jgi:23S rRNA (cytidine1920-2'-O)/16S rRNA (cytidine1409-2'-O)-methyltransferase